MAKKNGRVTPPGTGAPTEDSLSPREAKGRQVAVDAAKQLARVTAHRNALQERNDQLETIVEDCLDQVDALRAELAATRETVDEMVAKQSDEPGGSSDSNGARTRTTQPTKGKGRGPS